MESSAFADQTSPQADVEMTSEFVFQQTLALHTGAVRSVGHLKNGNFLMSGSVDTTNKIYTLDEINGKYTFDKEIQYHEGFVMNIIPTCTDDGFISAGGDKKIYQLDCLGTPIMEYNGHDAKINSLSQCDPTYFVSGGWDGTAKIWDVASGKITQTLEGHSYAVTVLTLPNGITITGSQDGIIHLWHQGVEQKKFKGHNDIIRGIVEVPGLGFATCSNDEMVKVWTLEGDEIHTMQGHTTYIFAICALASGEIVTGGDDCHLRVWSPADGKLKQTIQMPKTIWSICTNKLGDIIVGSDDKTIRTFTRDHTRMGVDEDLKAFEQDCAASAAKQVQYDLTKLKDFDSEVNGIIMGNKDGQTEIYKNQNKPTAYGWNKAENKWNFLGEVVADPNGPGGGDSVGVAQTKHYQGDNLFPAGEYDHVFDVELGDGIMRKLPFNNGASRAEASEKFCARESLGRANVEQINGFLQTNALAYATRDTTEKKEAPKAKCQYIPFNNYLFFEAAKLDGCTKKVMEFNAEHNVLDEQDLVFYEALCKVLTQTDAYHSTKIGPKSVAVLRKLLEGLPKQKRFPVYDLYRVFVNHPECTQVFQGSDGGAHWLQYLISALEDTECHKATPMLCLRALCNLFKHGTTLHMVQQRRETIMNAAAQYVYSEDKNVRAAATSLFLNYSVIGIQKTDFEGSVQSAGCLSERIPEEKEVDVMYRMVLTCGNLMDTNADTKQMIMDLDFKIPAISTLSNGGATDQKMRDTIKSIGEFYGLFE